LLDFVSCRGNESAVVAVYDKYFVIGISSFKHV
jgi:hypothetical protein